MSSSIEQRLQAPQTVFGNSLVSRAEQPTVAGILWNSNLGANARWHKNQQIEMELRRTGSSVPLNSTPVSDEGVYSCAVTHSRIDHSPVVVCVCLGTDFGRLQPALYSGVAHGISEDVHELWVVHRANVNARHRDFLL